MGKKFIRVIVIENRTRAENYIEHPKEFEGENKIPCLKKWGETFALFFEEQRVLFVVKDTRCKPDVFTSPLPWFQPFYGSLMFNIRDDNYNKPDEQIIIRQLQDGSLLVLECSKELSEIYAEENIDEIMAHPDNVLQECTAENIAQILKRPFGIDITLLSEIQKEK